MHSPAQIRTQEDVDEARVSTGVTAPLRVPHSMILYEHEVPQSTSFHIFKSLIRVRFPSRLPHLFFFFFFFHLSFILFLALYGFPFQLLTIITYDSNPSLTAHIITPLFGNLDSYPLIHRLSLYFLIPICSRVSNGFQCPAALICFSLFFSHSTGMK